MLFNTYFSFYIYFTSKKHFLYSKQINFPMIINYNRNIRRLLKETKTICTFESVESDVKYKYYCQVDEEIANIKGIELISDFDFGTQGKVSLTGISPLAKKFMNNMKALAQDNIITIY